MQPGLQRPGHVLETFPGRWREDELKARGTFSCYNLCTPPWEQTHQFCTPKLVARQEQSFVWPQHMSPPQPLLPTLCGSSAVPSLPHM